MERIVTLTLNPALDRSTKVSAVRPEAKLRCHDSKAEPGGGGINVARAVRKLGGEAVAVFPTGGARGARLCALLEQEEVQTRSIQARSETRENLTVYEESSGDQFRFTMPGATLTEDESEGCLDALAAEAAPLVVASGSLPPGAPDDVYARVAERVREHGGRLILDTSGPALRRASASGVYLLKPNMREFRALAERDVDSEEDQEAVAAAWIDAGRCEVLILSLGSAGVLLATRDGCERIPAPSVRIRSRVGAGDSMVGGIVLGLARGHTLRAAVCYGVAAGTAAVMTSGTELCRREDTETLFERLCERCDIRSDE